MSTWKQRREELQHLAVHGYIREKFKDPDFPNDLKQICYQFYLRVFDQWNIDRSNENLNIDVKSGIIDVKYENTPIWVTAFGSVDVKKGEIETWKINPLSTSDSGRLVLCVGIIEADKASSTMKELFGMTEQVQVSLIEAIMERYMMEQMVKEQRIPGNMVHVGNFQK